MRQIDGGERLGQRADLVDLDQQRIGKAILDALPQPRRVGDEQIVADELVRLAERIGQRFPAGEIILGHAVFDAEDRVIAGQRDIIVGHRFRRQLQAFGRQHIMAIVEELGRRRVERDEHILAGLEARLGNRRHHEIHRGAGAVEVRREAAFVAHRRRMAAGLQLTLERVENLRRPSAPLRRATTRRPASP